MEICCANCQYGPFLECREDKVCLDTFMGIRKQGKHYKYYNHFKPKEDKMAFIPSGGYGKTTPNIEYKPTGKSLTAREVIADSNISVKETLKFMEWLDVGYPNFYMGDDLIILGAFLNYALNHTCFRDFLLKGGYIEKVEEEWVSPRVGDRFKRGKEEYTLNSWGDYLVGINLHDGGRPSNCKPAKVVSVFRITKEEFQKICGSIPVDELERI